MGINFIHMQVMKKIGYLYLTILQRPSVFLCSVLKYFLMMTIFMHFFSAEAQVKRKIKKGRRNKSESHFSLDKGYFEIDWEVGHEVVSSDLSTFIYPNLSLRYGISSRLEINAECSFLTAKDRSSGKMHNSSGIEPVLVGANYILLKDSEKRPAIMLSAQIAIPYLSSENFMTEYPAPVIELIVQQPVNQKWVFGLASGIYWDGFQNIPYFIYNASIMYNISQKWSVSTEFFGYLNRNYKLNNMDINFAYSVTDQLQFGITSGFGLSADAHKNYFALNGVWGFNSKKNKQHQATGS